MSAHLPSTGMVRGVFLALLAKFSSRKPKVVNVGLPSNGMALPVLAFPTAIMGRCGMCIPIVVSVLIICTGIEVRVRRFLFVMVVECSTLPIAVSVLLVNSGMGRGVHLPLVWGIKFGTVQSASVRQGDILTVQHAWNVSMGKNGMKKLNLVNVYLGMNGMDKFVRRHIHVLEIEFGIRPSSNVFVHLDTIGVVGSVWYSLYVQEDRDGILEHFSVFALEAPSGILSSVSIVGMGKYGMNHRGLVCVQEVQCGITSFVV